MVEILQMRIPYDVGTPTLPGTKPFDMKDWLWQDDAFAAQMKVRDELIAKSYDDVAAVTMHGWDAADELYQFVLDWLRDHAKGYAFGSQTVTRPDGVSVLLRPDDPMGTLGRLVQEDLCLMLKPDGADEHALVAALLCFPANWRLREKLGRPLIDIHAPVPCYDGDVARRVQRLFDGVRVDRPVWRYNALHYADPALHQPYRRSDACERGGQGAPYLRSERQCILRLPKTRACVFSIHTFVVR